ncbi:hypothetical protein PF005_g4752 [Phytophthora fragariae]|uniref:Uncharacterized protein n=1 Tax=Phytophthora fragariae TaxID=53985 RepID=A0A6A3KT62_9STRA|nr:hypothetical protein PF003_g14387 [Phytophthora fragariae]KAE8945489.1 hypothetical protein PF009_g4858 [Phytophthora fragariae]KAE9008455.1 hypothetical protein PF011_g10700 [Phytophthora fragariae]KAE9130163.1 hypothetical protein PF010_g3926 [Phytophthora fragariae]KAE9130200.1 hypothetical protein PF007_g4612 [Phytophthora fragariae]
MYFGLVGAALDFFELLELFFSLPTCCKIDREMSRHGPWSHFVFQSLGRTLRHAFR